MTDLRTLPGVGAGLAAELRASGFRDVEALRAAGVDEAARRLAEFGMRDPAQIRQALVVALGGGSDDPAPEPIALLGVHAMVFTVGDLDSAVDHYSRIGMPAASREIDPPMALLHTGSGVGLVLLEDRTVPEVPSTAHSPRLLLVVSDVRAAADRLCAAGVDPLAEPSSAAAGDVVEVADRWGNVVGLTAPGPRRAGTWET